MKDTIATLRLKLIQLQALHDEGTLSAEGYAAAKAGLERKLLDRLMAAPQESLPAVAPAAAAARGSWKRPAAIGATVLAVAGVGYGLFGAPLAPSAAPGSAVKAPRGEASATPHAGDEQQLASAVDKLALRLKTEPDNAQGWAMLARSYARLGRHAEALPAFERAVTLHGEDPRLLADYADTMAVQNNRSLAGEPMKLVQRALQLDPASPKALALAGTDAFARQDYATAVKHWEKLAQVTPVDAAYLPDLPTSIRVARQKAGLPDKP